MKLSYTILVPLFAATLAQASVIEYRARKREFVTMVTTVDMGLADFLDALANPAPTSTAPAPPPPAAATTAPAPAPVASAPAAPAAAPAPSPAAAPASSSSSGGFFSGLWDSFKNYFDGGSSSNAQPAAAPAPVSASPAPAAAAPTSAQPAPVSSAPSLASPSTNQGFWPFTSTSSSDASSSGTNNNNNNPGGLTGNAASAVGAGGISYSPYTKSGKCKSASEVKHDIGLLSNFDIIRLYGVDCSGVENVLAAISNSQKVFVGIYNIDDYNINQDLTILKNAVATSSRGWSAIHTVSIGNELVNAGTVNAGQIVNAMKSARSWFKQNAPNYTGPLVSVDTLVAVLNNPSLCDASDYIAVNCHPFWDGGVAPGNSGPWLEQQIANLKSKCNNGKDILITESGWPTQGKSFGNCVPSQQNQLSAIKSIVNSLGSKVLMFTTYDDYWKDGGSYGVEKFWGIFGDPSA